MDMPFTLGSNVDDPTALTLFEHFGTSAFPRIEAYEFGANHVLPSFVRDVEFADGSVGPSPLNYEAFRRVGAFAKLKDAGILTSIGVGAVKVWDPYGETLREQMHEICAAVRAAGGTIQRVTMDEPFSSSIPGKYAEGIPGHTLKLTAACTANYIREAHDEGLLVYNAEACSNHTPQEIVEFLSAVGDEGQMPDGFVWDIDIWSWGGAPNWWERLLRTPQGLDIEKNRQEVARACVWMRQHGLKVAAYAVPQGDINTDQDCVRSAVALNDQYARYFPALLDEIYVMSWVLLKGLDPIIAEKVAREHPPIFPETDTRNSLLYTLQACQARWARVPPAGGTL